jgi:hypothetical protein
MVMSGLSVSPVWNVRLEAFRSLFTKPGFRLFCAFVLVLAHTDGRLWVTSVALSGLLDRHLTRFYGFLKQGAWSLSAVRRTLYAQCLAVCVGADARLLQALDDTVCAKYGRKFDVLGVHHDPMNRQHPRQLSRGHCFVCLALLGQPIKQHFVALFVGCALYVQKHVRQAANEAAEKAGKALTAFATKLELAAGLVLDLPVPPGVIVIAVCDGAYARKAFVQPVCASGRHVLSRLRSDAVFYDLPPVQKKQPNGKKAAGRPRKYGRKHKAREWAALLSAWREVTLTLYGKQATMQIKARVVIQRTFGVRMRLVAVQWGERPLVFLFCTDTTMTPEAIVRAYCARFAIETGFRDAKQSFGLSTYQVRNEQGFVRLVHLCLWAQTLLRLVCWTEKPQPVYGDWRKPLGYLTLTQQKRLSQQTYRVSAGSYAHPHKAQIQGAEVMAA